MYIIIYCKYVHTKKYMEKVNKICSNQKSTNKKRMIILLYISDPDCFELVSISEDRSSTKNRPPAIKKKTANEPLFL